MNKTNKQKIQGILEEVTDIIEVKYEKQYIPQINDIINEKAKGIALYFNNGSFGERIETDEYVKQAKEELLNQINNLLLQRQHKKIEQTSTKIIDNYRLNEKLKSSDNEEKNEIDKETEDMKNYIIRIKFMIENTIKQTAREIGVEMQQKFDEEKKRKFELIVYLREEEITKTTIERIEQVIQPLDKELIEEINKKCGEFVKTCIKKEEKLQQAKPIREDDDDFER